MSAPLATGTRLGPYEITAKLGEGGMGEVWRATDSRLRREVAIKVLPQAFTADPERLARFEREAQLLAQLHHPNIASIFGLEESDGIRALVMELVEGPTLAERLDHGALPLDESLAIARQIAEALEEAHEKGIVHRDLKPQNVKVTAEGKVKVLDFGLAKALDSTAASGSPSTSPTLMNSPTLTAAHGTQLGVILGSAAYMSPEQAKGFAVDKRADIWAFGVVLFEMLSGRRLFDAPTVPETLAQVLTRTPDLDELPASTPAVIRGLLRRCLERNPKNRLRDIGDARILLQEASGASADEHAGAPQGVARRSPARIAAASLVALAALFAAVLIGRKTAPQAAAGAADVDAGFDEFTHLTHQSGLESSPSLSPDGEFVAYVAIAGGNRDIFLLRAGGQKPINLTADSPADEEHPAFSPDGRFIAFRSERGGGGLFVMGATGESVRRLTSFGDNPSWSPDGRQIVFATEGKSDPNNREKQSELWVVAAGGGEPHRIFAGDAVQPSWSPAGHRIAYWAVDSAKGLREVWTIAADGSDPRRVTDGRSVDWDAVWGHDGRHLYFVSDRSGASHPWRVPIDERSGRLLGDPQPIHLPTSWSGQLSFSADGRRIVYRTSERTAEVRRLPFDVATGRVTGPAERLFDTTIPAVGLDVTADGWMLFRTLGSPEDIYVMRTDGGGLRKLTDDVAAKDRGPSWSPDGKQAAFYSNRSGRYEIWTVDRDGSNLRQRTLAGASSVLFPIWSPDGRAIVAASRDVVVRFAVRDQPVPGAEFETLPIDRGDAASLIPTSWSPDGRKLACVREGQNGQLLGGLLIYDLSTRKTSLLPVELPTPPAGSVFPTIAWLPDSRRGVVRWGESILLVDTAAEKITTLVQGFNRDGGIARLSGDGRWIYMVDAREEGDLWMASRSAARPSSASGASAPAQGRTP